MKPESAAKNDAQATAINLHRRFGVGTSPVALKKQSIEMKLRKPAIYDGTNP
jgi:hypothetical protein